MRRYLGLSPDEHLDERGVHLPPQTGELASAPSGPPRGDVPEPGEVVLTEEWLDDSSLEEHFSEDRTLAAAFPSGQVRVKRSDFEPAIVLFEGLPAPANSLGHVHCVEPGRWVMDTRGEEPAALVVAFRNYDLIIWGQLGAVRLFTVRTDPGQRATNPA